MKKLNLNLLHDEVKLNEVLKASQDLWLALLGHCSMRFDETMAFAYLLYKVGNSERKVSYADVKNSRLPIDKFAMDFIRKTINEDVWKHILPLLERYEADTFGLVAMSELQRHMADVDAPVPNALLELSEKLLACQAKDVVADFGCGWGGYLLYEAQRTKRARYIGYDMSNENLVIAGIKADLMGCAADFRVGDIFMEARHSDGAFFTKIYANSAIISKSITAQGAREYMRNLSSAEFDSVRGASADWLSCYAAAKLLKAGGRAVILVNTGSTMSTGDRAVRQKLAEDGFIESVIALPNKFLTKTNIYSSLVVLSHGNKQVRLVDATDMCKHGRRANELTAENLAEILAALQADGEHSKAVGMAELKENLFVMNHSEYVRPEVSFANGVPLKSVVKSISRGAAVPAVKLDEIMSAEPTDCQYLLMANIRDGLIDEELPYIKAIDPKDEKCCLKNDSLVVSKSGAPFKIAVAKVQAGQKILANGNLYIIELDETKVNPYFLKTYLESEQGMAVLKSIAVGASLPIISLEKLKNMMIPLPSLEQQQLVAEQYLAAVAEFKQARTQLDQATKKLLSVYENAGV